MTFETGTQLGRFVVEKQLGKGAAGVVYLATDTRLNQKVALKLLHPWLAEDPEVLERFKREIVLTRRIAHPGVCRLHDLHEEDGQTFITMEYVEGQTLAALIHKEGRLSPLRTLEILRGLASPLDAAHAAGVVHRDLKPGNVLVKPDGSLCVLDFGMATAGDVTKITRAGRTVGSLRFIAPEVWEGNGATAASDRYAVGVIIYACLAGRLPFEAATPAEAFQAQKEQLTSLSQHNELVTPAVNNVVKKMMARKPGDRYQDVTAMLYAFEAALGSPHRPATNSGAILRPRNDSDAGAPADARAETTSTENVRRAARNPVPRLALAGAGGVGVIVIAAVVAALASRPAAEDNADRADRPDAGAPSHTQPGRAPAPGIASEPGGADGTGDPERVDQRDRSEARTPGALGVKAAALAAMKRKGLISGDVPALDAELARARGLEKSGRDASAAWEKARAIAGREVIDRGFITSKQKRLRFAAERASGIAQAKIAALTAEAEKHVVARRYETANDRLNKAFALVK